MRAQMQRCLAQWASSSGRAETNLDDKAVPRTAIALLFAQRTHTDGDDDVVVGFGAVGHEG